MSNSRIVKYAKVHEEIFIPGLGSLGTTLPSQSKTVKDLNMYTAVDGLVVKSGSYEVLIPFANVVLMSLAPATSTRD